MRRCLKFPMIMFVVDVRRAFYSLSRGSYALSFSFFRSKSRARPSATTLPGELPFLRAVRTRGVIARRPFLRVHCRTSPSRVRCVVVRDRPTRVGRTRLTSQKNALLRQTSADRGVSARHFSLAIPSGGEVPSTNVG